ncbi:MAG: S8 family serine peptidase, partial [bacterium]
WIYFRDKGPLNLAKNASVLQEAESRLTKRAIARREKVLGKDNVVQKSDLAIYRPYLQNLEVLGIRPIFQSRWLNAMSAHLTAKQVDAVRDLVFVEKVAPVRKMAAPEPIVVSQRLHKDADMTMAQTVLDYGASLRQNAQINVTALHDAGIFGENVLVGMLDTGFFTENHEAFSALEILGEFDFIFDDSVTSNQTGDVSSQHNHGTWTLSIIAGFAPGNLIGPAYKSKFYLSKTEHIPSETRVEEDNWMAAIEWMEAQGIDVASSSLGYRDFFDNPAENYGYSDLDGETAVVTRAAQMATEKGVVVVTSAGNEGNDNEFPYIGGPADGRDVLAIGAVNGKGTRVGFSSIGPTFDGRIKPDVMAMGAGVSLVNVNSTDGYFTGQGTSFSCPLVAGVAAQILSAHPHLTPLQVNQALRMTADRANAPDNEYGYGIIDAREAITYWGPAFSNEFTIDELNAGKVRISTRTLVGKNESIKSMDLHWRLQGDSEFNIEPMSQIDSTLFNSGEIASPSKFEIEFFFTVQIPAKGVFTYPQNAPGELLHLEDLSNVPQAFFLEQNYPNPFILTQNTATRIQLSLLENATVTVIVYNVLGQEIARLLDNAEFSIGQQRLLSWDGRSHAGTFVATGIYFFQAEFTQVNGERTTIRKKLAVIR